MFLFHQEESLSLDRQLLEMEHSKSQSLSDISEHLQSASTRADDYLTDLENQLKFVLHHNSENNRQTISQYDFFAIVLFSANLFPKHS